MRELFEQEKVVEFVDLGERAENAVVSFFTS